MSITHWFLILAILLLLFGPSKLPGLGTSLGKAIRGFKSGLNDPDPETTTTQTSRPEQIESGVKVGDSVKAKETTKV